MTYGNMYEILMYITTNKINVSKETIEYLKTLPSINYLEFSVLKHSLPIIKLYFNSPSTPLLSFLSKVKLNLYSSEDIINYSTIIISEKNNQIQELLVRAFLNYKLRGNKHAITLISNEKNIDRLIYLVKACEENNILRHPELLDYINAALTDSMMAELIKGFSYDLIANNKTYVNYLISQRNAASINLVYTAILTGIDIHYPEVLNQIVFEENVSTKHYMTSACKLLSIKQTKEIFPLLKSTSDDVIKGVIFDAIQELTDPSDWQEFVQFYQTNPQVLPKVLEKKIKEIKENREAIKFHARLNEFLSNPNSDNIYQFLNLWDSKKDSPALSLIRTKEIPTNK